MWNGYNTQYNSQYNRKPMIKAKKAQAITLLSFLLALILACNRFVPEPTLTPVLPAPTLMFMTQTAPAPVPAPVIFIQASAETIQVGERVTLTLQVRNVKDADCSKLYYRDGSMRSFGWLGEASHQILALAAEPAETGNLEFTLEGKVPGTAEIKAACQGNVLFRKNNEFFPDPWFGVSEVLLITVR